MYWWILNEECGDIINYNVKLFHMAKYSEKAQATVARAVRKMKKGELKSGSGDVVTDPKQAIAIGISEAAKKGYKVPKRKTKKSTRSTR
jgi:hypothetical protein